MLTHENAPKTAYLDRSHRDQIAPNSGSPFRPLYKAELEYSQQPVALVVAETFEAARYAASLVKVEYDVTAHETDLQEQLGRAHEPTDSRGGYVSAPKKPRGKPDEAFEAAPFKVEAEYHQPIEHHNPMEPYSCTAVFGADGKLTLYAKTQGVQNCRDYICSVFGLPSDGGAGHLTVHGRRLRLRPAAHVRDVPVGARCDGDEAFGARDDDAPADVFLFAPAGGYTTAPAWPRPGTALIESITHTAIEETSRNEEYLETVVNWSGQLYTCPNVSLDHRLVNLDLASPADMRAPGATTGIHALECAVDELAYAAGVDPLEFRLRNYAEKDQNMNLPFSSKELRKAYKLGAEKFGWKARKLEPRSMKSGNNLIGWGVATGSWEAMQGKGEAKAVLTRDGKLTVSCATSDIGTGTYTVMTMIAAEYSGVPIEDVTFKLGDSDMVYAPVEGGSWTVSSVGSAVKSACEELRGKLFKLAQNVENSPVAGVMLEDVTFDRSEIRVTKDPFKNVTYAEAMQAGGIDKLEVDTTELPQLLKQHTHSAHSHSAVFAEVTVDESLGTVHCTRVVSAIAGGRILNPKTARSQIMGAVIWGISMALQEESVMDHDLGRFMNHNFAEYHIPVNADIHDIDVIFVPEHDEVVNPLGAKGLGEIGLVGVAAAITNAVWHATGRRVRDLPITLDKLL